jgi:hypothetical protein
MCGPRAVCYGAVVYLLLHLVLTPQQTRVRFGRSPSRAPLTRPKPTLHRSKRTGGGRLGARLLPRVGSANSDALLRLQLYGLAGEAGLSSTLAIVGSGRQPLRSTLEVRGWAQAIQDCLSRQSNTTFKPAELTLLTASLKLSNLKF